MPVLDKALAPVIAGNESLRTGLGTGSFQDYSPETRQLVAESAAIQSGNRGLLEQAPTREFIATGRVNPMMSNDQSQQGPEVPTPTSSDVGSPRYALNPPGDAGAGSTLVDYINGRYSSVLKTPKSEQEILADKMNEIQGAVDQLNNVYAYRLQDAQAQGRAQSNRASAVNAAGGIAYTPMGEAKLSEVDRQNKRVMDEINAQRAQEIANLYRQARGEATQEVQFNTKQYQDAVNSYVDNLARAFQIDQNEKQNITQNALAVAALTGSYGGEPTLALRNFFADIQDKAMGRELEKQKLDAEIAQAKAAGYKISQFDDGTVAYFDPVTQKLVPLGNYAKPRGSGTDGTKYQFQELDSGTYGAFNPSTGVFKPQGDIWSENGTQGPMSGIRNEG